MFKGLLLSILIIIYTSDSQAQITFQKTYGGTSSEGAKSVQQTTDGGYIIAGSTSDNIGPGNADFYLIRTNALGDTLWTKTFDRSDNDHGYSVQQTSDGGYIIAGDIYSVFTNHDICLIRTDDSGNILWVKSYGGPFTEYAYSVKQTSDGGFIVAGETSSFGAGVNDVYLIKTDSAGNQVWSKTYGGIQNDYAMCVQQTTDKGYIIAGYTNSFGVDSDDVYVIKTDSNGTVIWEKTYGGFGEESASSVQQTTDGGYIISGFTNSFGTGNDDVYLIRTDNIGNVLWSKTYTGITVTFNYSVSQTNDAGFIIAGINLIKTDSLGNLVWSKNFGGTNGDGGSAVQQTSDRGFIVAGYTGWAPPDFADVYLIKTDSNGVSGCNESNPVIVVSNPATQVGLPVSIISSAATTTLTPVVAVHSMGKTITTRCSSCNLSAIIPTLSNLTICSGDSVTLHASSVTALFYQWRKNGVNISGATTDSVTIAADGNYSCFVTNVCDSLSSNAIVITVVPLPSAMLNLNGVTTFCQGDSILLSANSEQSYLWSTNDTVQNIYVLSPGNYFVTVTDSNGCSASSDTISITVNPLPVVTINSSNSTTFCEGDSVILTANPEISYLWSTNDTIQSIIVSTSGNYFVTVTDSNGCSATSDTITTVVNPLPIVTFTGLQDTTCINAPPFTLTGSPSGGTFSGAGVTNGLFNPTVAFFGNHIILYSYIDTLGCSNSASQSVFVDVCMNVQNMSSSLFSVIVFPNPSTRDFNLTVFSSDSKKCSLRIYDLTGREIVYRNNIPANENISFGNELSTGFYFAEIIQGDSKKIIQLIKGQ